MAQQDGAKGKKGPPKFQHLPQARAKKLKSAWVQTRKIKSKWNAEKRRDGIQTEPSTPGLVTPVPNVSGIPGGKKPNGQPQPIDVDTIPDAPPSLSEERPVKKSSIPRTTREPVRASRKGPTEGSSQQKDRRSGRPSGYQGKKPSMRNQINALLEKIQRDID